MNQKVEFRSRGQELVEFALTLPIFLILVFGILDMGRAVYYYSAIHNGAREGARYGIIDPDDAAGIRAAARRITPGLVLNDGDILIGVIDGNVFCPGAQGPCPDVIWVEVSYTFSPVTPLIGAFLPGGTLTLSSRSTMQVER